MRCEDFFTEIQFREREEVVEQEKLAIEKEKLAAKVRNQKRAADQAKKLEAESKRTALAEQQRLDDLRRKGWPEKMVQAVKSHEVFIDLSSEEAEESWGSPEDKNRTITASGNQSNGYTEIGDTFIVLEAGPEKV